MTTLLPRELLNCPMIAVNPMTGSGAPQSMRTMKREPASKMSQTSRNSAPERTSVMALATITDAEFNQHYGRMVSGIQAGGIRDRFRKGQWHTWKTFLYSYFAGHP